MALRKSLYARLFQPVPAGCASRRIETTGLEGEQFRVALRRSLHTRLLQPQVAHAPEGDGLRATASVPKHRRRAPSLLPGPLQACAVAAAGTLASKALPRSVSAQARRRQQRCRRQHPPVAAITWSHSTTKLSVSPDCTVRGETRGRQRDSVTTGGGADKVHVPSPRPPGGGRGGAGGRRLRQRGSQVAQRTGASCMPRPVQTTRHPPLRSCAAP